MFDIIFAKNVCQNQEFQEEGKILILTNIFDRNFNFREKKFYFRPKF